MVIVAVIVIIFISNRLEYYSVCIAKYFLTFSAPFIITSQDVALAVNSRSAPELTFANVNGQELDEGISVVVGSPISVKCAALGNGAPIWSWTFSNRYTEITDNSISTTVNLER